MKLYERFGFKLIPYDDAEFQLEATVGTLRRKSRRSDAAPRGRKGKRCGASNSHPIQQRSKRHFIQLP